MRKFFIKTPFDMIRNNISVCHIKNDLSIHYKEYSDLEYGDVFMITTTIPHKSSDEDKQIIEYLFELSSSSKNLLIPINNIISRIERKDFINISKACDKFKSIFMSYPNNIISDEIVEEVRSRSSSEKEENTENVSSEPTSNIRFYIKIDDKSNVFPHNINVFLCGSERSTSYKDLPLYSVFCLDKYMYNLSDKSKKEVDVLQEVSRVLRTLSRGIKVFQKDNLQFHPFDMESRENNNNSIELYSNQISVIISAYMRFITGVTDISALRELVRHTAKWKNVDSRVFSQNCNNTSHDDEFEVTFFNACEEAGVVIW